MSVPLICLFCEETIAQTDDLARHLIGTENGLRLAHEECLMRSIIGGVNHLQGNCSCNGCNGSMPPDPPNMTRREAARAAYEVFLRRRGQR